MALAKRASKKMFMEVNNTINRMKGFTSLPTSRNPKEYTRKYVDLDHEVTDLVGISTSKEFTFDHMPGDIVHDKMVDIIDKEKIGEDAIVTLVQVDFTQAGATADSFVAVKRDFVLIPGTEGDNADAYTYSGTFKVKGERIEGEVTSSDNWETCSFNSNGGLVTVEITPDSPTATAGNTIQLTATVVGTNETEVAWTSSDNTVAVVDSTGLVTIDETSTVGETATITATLVSNPNAKDDVIVTVS